MEEGKLFFLLLPLYLLSTKVLKKCQGIAQIMSGHFMEKTPLVTRYLYLREKTHQIQSLVFDDDVAIRCFRFAI